ncbi:MAG: HAMP domain-containing sensor histidine kinase, partial [Miltoncostaeaceae bacterium]
MASGDLDARVDLDDGELARAAASLNAMTAQLAATDRRQREFLADVAHELRTPITAIDGFASALVDGAARTDDDRREAAEIIKGESGRLCDLVADLQALTLADLDQEVVREPTDLVECCREVVERLEHAAGERGVLLRGPRAGQDPVVAVTNAAHVQTIASNLVTNAIRATPPGGSVRVSAIHEGGSAVVEVADTGVGIAPEHLPHIFDRLYRADSARDRASGGTGLGLSISQELVRLMGGDIEVRSAPEQGTTFRFVIPLPVLEK